MIKLSDVSFFFGGRDILKHAELLIRDDDKIGLVGPNGAGKSTLFKIITGELSPTSGAINTDRKKAVIGYLSQDTGEMKGRTVLEEVLAGAGRIFSIKTRLEELEAKMGDMENPITDAEMDEYGILQNEFINLDGYNLETNAEIILTGLGFPIERQSEMVDNFSGGWKMRIAMARLLLLNPDVLLMDEPTNHLDLESIIFLESWLKEYKGALVMTCHDREFMTRICRTTVELNNGILSTYSGDYDFYLREKEVRRAQLVATYERQQAMLQKEEEFIAKFAARASHANLVQSRIKTIEKIERVELPPEEKVINIEFQPCPRSGDQVAVLENLGHSYGDHKVFANTTVTLRRLEKVALSGINGAGKSTLLKIMAGLLENTEGSCTIGSSVKMGYFSQYSSDLLNMNNTIYEEAAERLPMLDKGEIMSVLGAFRFSGTDTEKKISVLSGGEKSRVVLACILARPVNFLVLDEPTNHLDIQSREVLLDALKRFDGTIIIVSHDRFFLRSLVNKVYELDTGKLTVYEGDYSYYLEKSPHLKEIHLM
ncbi:MAG: ABC-F family ATP-binding cassette domain-containing protein [Spirochaetales bacterium]|nr:ABC-F family ATP-binding cassette domain-containing protein [Candidatus Physcosoma equi]